MTSPKTRTVLCDLDGTLVDTAEANYQAYRAALAEADVDFTWAQFLTTWGKDSRDFLPAIAPHLSAVDVELVRARKAQLYPDYLRFTRLNRPLLRTLAAMKVDAMMLLVTTAKRSNVTAVLEHHGLSDFFDHVVCGEDTLRSKPSADPYLHALRLAQSAAEDCVTFEDSESGIRSAREAGIDVVKVRFGDVE